MKPWLTACMLLLVAPAAAQSTPVGLPEQVHVTMDEGGLIFQWATVGVGEVPGDPPSVAWSLDGVAQTPVSGALAGTVLPRPAASGSSTAASDGGATTYVWAADADVARGARVEYSPGSDGRGRAGPFTVDQVPSLDAPLRFVAYGDIGTDATVPDGSSAPSVSGTEVTVASAAHAVRDLALAQGPDLVVLPGDLSYDNSRLGWDTFMRFMEPVQSSVVTMSSIGNHEWDDDFGYDQYLAEYVLPGDEQTYSFQAGPVTFVVLNSDALCAPGQGASGPPFDPCLGRPMPAAVTEDVRALLVEAEEDETPWTVVVQHHPLWSWGRHGSSVARQFLWQGDFEAYGVDVVLAAHDHLYSRSYPLLDGDPTTTANTTSQGDGIVHVVAGGGGRSLYNLPDGQPPAWHAYSEVTHHMTVWDVDHERLTMTALRADGSTMDSFTILAEGPGDPAQTSPAAPAVGTVVLLSVLGALLRRRPS